MGINRVIVSETGNVWLELRTPFAYLCELTDEIQMVKEQGEGKTAENKNGRLQSAVSSGAIWDALQFCGRDRIRTCDPV